MVELIVNQLKKIAMNKIKFIIAGVFILSLTIFTSCLKAGLDDLPAFADANITNVYFEYRYQDPADLWTDGSAKVKYVTLVVTKTIDATANTVVASLSVPKASGSLTEAERAKVALTNIVCMTSVSTAAKIESADGSPLLGAPGDFSVPRKYLVTAADGAATKTWTITLTALTKP